MPSLPPRARSARLDCAALCSARGQRRTSRTRARAGVTGNIRTGCSWRVGLSPTSANWFEKRVHHKPIWSWMPKEGRHSPNVFPSDGSSEDLIPCCPLALLALLHCHSYSFRFHLSPSLLNYHGCFGWCVCRGPSLKVVPSNSMTINLYGPSYFLKSQNCLWLLDLDLRSEFSSRTKLRHHFADSVVFGVVERPLCSDLTDFVFFNNGPERQPQSCAPTVESDRRYWWWQPQPLPCVLINFPLHFLHRRQSHFVYGEWPEQPWQENELQKPDFESSLKRRSGNCIQSIRHFVNCGSLLIFVTEQLVKNSSKALYRFFWDSRDALSSDCEVHLTANFPSGQGETSRFRRFESHAAPEE